MFHLHNHNKPCEQGGSLVELVIVAGIITGALSAILGLATVFLVNSGIVAQTTEATALAQETLEALRNYRDGLGWNDDNLGIEYDGINILPKDSYLHFEKSSDTPPRWKVVIGQEPMGNFTRDFVLEEVWRDTPGTDDITPWGVGALDPDTVRAIITVSWQEHGRSHKVELVAYLTNWQQL